MGIGSDLWYQFDALVRQARLGRGGISVCHRCRPCRSCRPSRRASGDHCLLRGSVQRFSDITTTTTLLIEQGDTVVAESGGGHSHRVIHGATTVIPATGKTQDFSSMSIIKVKDGTIVYMRDDDDLMTGLSQLGLLRPPDGPGLDGAQVPPWLEVDAAETAASAASTRPPAPARRITASQGERERFLKWRASE